MIKINRLIFVVFLASVALAGDDGLEDVAQFFDKAYTTALATLSRVREGVAKDFQELGRDHGLVADNLREEAAVFVSLNRNFEESFMDGVFLLEKRILTRSFCFLKD